MPELTREEINELLTTRKTADKQFFSDLLDLQKQWEYEQMHIKAVMAFLKSTYINKLKLKIKSDKETIAALRAEEEFSAENYKKIIELNSDISEKNKEIESYKSFFVEPYFARMDLVDNKEGYNSYYIGKRGDINLEIVDWRAPLAKKYYQKSQIAFTINEYDYKLILRRALRTHNGKLLDYKNEYLSVRDYLTKEEIAGRDEEIIFDPFLKEILRAKKEQSEISDIIETIQEQQYEIITKPERESFVVQGCAGSGKTMILLHRLSYLMYNNEKLKPRDVLVITPSDSFNAFIDELSAVLELEKVKTNTIDAYFLQLLKNEGVDISEKITEKTPDEYASYIYSDKFLTDTEKKLSKIYDGIAGMFLSDECKEVIDRAAADLKEQLESFSFLKNAGVRVRRAVLGEIKEKAEGGLYYTKPFRYLMNSVSLAEEFFSVTLKSDKISDFSYFYDRILAFYKSGMEIYRTHGKVTENALSDLENLRIAVEHEITDLRRYKIYRNGMETETYPDRIMRRQELLHEIEKAREEVSKISELFGAFCALFDVFRGNEDFVKIGKCETHLELARFFYKEIVRKIKNKLKMGKGLVRSDGYVLCLLLSLLGTRLEPRFGMVFVDEGQDISANEYALLKRINQDAAFNVYGDLAQNITKFRGVGDWSKINDGQVYVLDKNYRNTNQIVEFVGETLKTQMQPIGFDGPPVRKIGIREIHGFFKDKKGLKAIIVSERALEKYRRKSYNVLADTGKVSKKRINLMTVYESKGLEFTCVVVADSDMTPNEKYIAYTRALKELAVIGGKNAD